MRTVRMVLILLLISSGASVWAATVASWTAESQTSGGGWSNSGWDNRSFRILLEGSSIITSGSSVQITLRGRSSGDYTVQRVSLAKREGASLNIVTGTNQQLTFGGTWDDGVLVPAGGTVTSDPIPFDLLTGEDLFLTYWVPAGNPTVYKTGGSSTSVWSIAGADESATLDWGSLTISNTLDYVYIIEQVDVLDAAPPAPPAPGVALLDPWVVNGSYASQTATFNVSTGTDRLVLVALSAENNQNGLVSVGSVSLGNQLLTELFNFTVGSGTGYHNLHWLGYLLESQIMELSGSGLTIVYSNEPSNPFDQPKIHYASYEHVDQRMPIKASTSSTSESSLPLGFGLTAGVGDKIIGFNVLGQHYTPGVSTAGYTRISQSIGATNGHASAVFDRTVTTSITENPTFSSTTATRMAVSALVLSYADPVVNNDPPVITSTASVSVAENTTAVTTVTATDPDGDTPTFGLSGGVDAGLFTINSTTGVLTFSSAPDFETPVDVGGDNVYNVTVAASDGPNTGSQALTVTVTSLNDNPPVITSAAGVSVAENQTAVITVTATDADTPQANLTFSLSGDDQTAFVIGSTTGVLTFTNAPDFETPMDANTDNNYLVTVTADDGANTVFQNLTVTVDDVYEAEPMAVTLLDGWVVDGSYATQDATFNVSPGTNRIVVVALSAEKNQNGPISVTSVSLGDQVLTEVHDFTVGSSTAYHNLHWFGYLLESEIAARSGSGLTISYVIAPSNPFDQPKIHYASYENVDQTTPIADSDWNSSTRAPSLQLTGTMTAGDGDTIIGFNVAGQHYAPGLSTAEYTEETWSIGATNGHASAAYHRTATTGVTENPTFTVATATRMAVSAVVLKAAPPYAFDLASTEVCDGVDNDNDGYIDEDQTGWSGFCDPSALVTPEGYTFAYPLEYWTSAFDTLRYDTPSARDSYSNTLARAAAIDACVGTPHYYMHSVFKALLNMHLATGAARYLEESVELADLMIATSVVYDPTWAYPLVPAKFDAWIAEQGEIRFWSGDQCSWRQGSAPGYRYMINELQGIRGIARLARTLQEQGDPRWQVYFDYADQVISFYAMMGDAVPRIDNASDKRVHYIMSALDLYRASGEQRFLDWATALQGEVLGLSVKEVDGDFLAFAVGIGNSLDKVNDTSHANREAEMVRYWTEEGTPGTGDFMRRAVNTLLFRIWENQPIVQPANQYPYLFRNMTDGENSCQGVNSPYRLGSIDVGWNELARYDRRVLYIMESFTNALVDGTAAISFPAPADCTLSGNTNYSYIITAIAELAYAHSYTVPSTAGSPLLITSAANVSVAENRTAVLTVMTTAAAGTTLTFLLNGGADAGWFAIDSATGVLTFTDGRDYEAAVDADNDNDYLVTVMVSDGVNAASQDLTVTVTDVGEDPVGPIIDADALANQVAENAANGTGVKITALAMDPDGDTVTYTLDDDAGGRFTIHATTGAVTVLDGTLLDYEAAPSHDITIRATSWDFSETSVTVTINVTDVNEDPVGAISDNDLAVNSVPENSATSTVVGITAAATDPDDTDTESYTLDNDAGGRFAIHATTGAVTVLEGTLLDYEAAASHSITIRATSTDASFSTLGMTINLTDVNEPVGPVTDINGAANEVAENAATGTPVGIEWDAVEPDLADQGSPVIYLFDTTAPGSGSAGGRFERNTLSGIVYVKDGTLLDYETATSHQIYIKARSSDGTESFATATINLIDLNLANDAAPVITSNVGGATAVVNVAEGTTAVTTVTVTDTDTPQAELTFTLSGDDQAAFDIDGTTGVLTFTIVPDFENPVDANADNNYLVTVTVYDGANTVILDLTVTVDDVNDSPESRALFVAMDGDDASDGTSWSQAWRTPQHAFENVQPGDTVTIGDGHYPGGNRVYWQGRVDAPIVIQAQNPGRVVIDGGARIEGWQLVPGLQHTWSADVPGDIPVLLVSEADTRRVLHREAQGDDCERELGCWAFDEQSRQLYVRTSTGLPPDSHVIEAAFESLGLFILGPENTAEPPRYIVLRGLVFKNFGDVGVRSQNGEHILIEDCQVLQSAQGLELWYNSYATVRRCEVWATYDQASSERAAIIFHGTTLDSLAEDNYVHDVSQGALLHYGGTGSPGTRIDSNLVVNAEIFYFKGGTELGMPDRNVVVNTAVFGRPFATTPSTGANTIVGDTNNITPSPDDLNVLLDNLADARFADPAYHDYRLQSDSPHRVASPDVLGAFPYEDVVFYVAPWGSDTNLGTNERQAWRTLARAVRDLGPGQTLYLLPGTYNEPLILTRGGDAQAPVTIRAYGKGLVVIDSGSEPGIQLVDTAYVELAGIEVRGVTGPAISLLNSPNCTLNGMIIRDNTKGVTAVSSPYGRMEHSLVGNNEEVGLSLVGSPGWVVTNTAFVRNIQEQIFVDEESLSDAYLQSNAYDVEPTSAMGHWGLGFAISFDAWLALTEQDGASVVGTIDLLAAQDGDFDVEPGSLLAGAGWLGATIGPGELDLEPVPPEFENLRTDWIGANSAVTIWETPQYVGRTMAWYGTDPSLEQKTMGVSGPIHSVTFSDLQPDTVYYYRVATDWRHPDLPQVPPIHGDSRGREYSTTTPDDFADIATELAALEQLGVFTGISPLLQFRTLASPPPGRALYVSTTGDDSADGLSLGTAWQTLYKAANQARPGDEVIIEPGTYDDAIVPISGGATAERRITYRSSSWEPVILIGTDRLRRFAVKLRGHRHMTFQGFHFRGHHNQHSGQMRLEDLNEDIIIRHSFFDGRGNWTVGIITLGNSTNEVTIEDSAFISNWRPVSVWNGAVDIRNTVFDVGLFSDAYIYHLDAQLSIENSVSTSAALAKTANNGHMIVAPVADGIVSDFNRFYFQPYDQSHFLVRLGNNNIPEVTYQGLDGLQAWQQDTGNDLNSLIIEDPGFLTYDALEDRGAPSPDTAPFWLDDYRLAPDSPLRGAGSDGGDIGIRFP